MLNKRLSFSFSNNGSGFDSFSPEGDDGNYEVCIANISPKERRKRLNFGIAQFVITLVILAVLLMLGVDKLWRLPLYFLFAASAAGYFQWRDKT
jgi:hypothetical protein